MSPRSRLWLAGSLLFVLGVPALAADPPITGGIWDAPQYDDIQGTAGGIDKVVSVLFDNFQFGSDVGDGELALRKTLGMSFPLKLGSGEQVTALKTDIRGHFVGSEGALATLVVVIGKQMESMQFPTASAQDDAIGEDFILSLSGDEVFASGSSIPLTIFVVAHKPTAEGSFLFSVDSIDMAAETK